MVAPAGAIRLSEPAIAPMGDPETEPGRNPLPPAASADSGVAGKVAGLDAAFPKLAGGRAPSGGKPVPGVARFRPGLVAVPAAMSAASFAGGAGGEGRPPKAGKRVPGFGREPVSGGEPPIGGNELPMEGRPPLGDG